MSRLSALHIALAAAHSAGADGKVLDGIMALCDDGECSECARIICPFDDFMHFHHDGCPSCTAHEEAAKAAPDAGGCL